MKNPAKIAFPDYKVCKILSKPPCDLARIAPTFCLKCQHYAGIYWRNFRKTKNKICLYKVLFCILLLILITRVIMCWKLTFNKKGHFLLYRLFIILVHFAAIVAVASFHNPHAISHTSAVLHNESVFSPNNNWRWSTFCQTPQEWGLVVQYKLFCRCLGKDWCHWIKQISRN